MKEEEEEEVTNFKFDTCHCVCARIVPLSCARACPGAQCAYVRARNESNKIHKLKPALTTMDIHTIQATTEDGFSSPTFHRGPPPPGIDSAIPLVPCLFLMGRLLLHSFLL